MGVPVRLHKLIYKFTDDLNDMIHDVKLQEMELRGESKDKKVIGQASILDLFEITASRGVKQVIFGSKALSGELHSKNKYQVVRGEYIVQDELTISTLKHHKKSVSLIEKGQECGISFNSKKGIEFDFKRGDILECYEEVEKAKPKFSLKPGLVKTF